MTTHSGGQAWANRNPLGRTHGPKKPQPQPKQAKNPRFPPETECEKIFDFSTFTPFLSFFSSAYYRHIKRKPAMTNQEKIAQAEADFEEAYSWMETDQDYEDAAQFLCQLTPGLKYRTAPDSFGVEFYI